MDSIRKKYRLIIVIVLLTICVAISAAYISVLNRIKDTYQSCATDTFINEKKTFLKDTVNNVIFEMESKQEEQVDFYSRILGDIINALDVYYQNSPAKFIDFSIDIFQGSENSAFSFVIVKRNTGDIVYSSPELGSIENRTPDDLTSELSTSPIFVAEQYGAYNLIFAVSKEHIDQTVKNQMYDEIHGYTFSDDAYMWVNEIINYDGGDNFAIRLIYPFEKDEEGQYLSTNTADIAGNLPYSTELEGVKREGEIFFTYYFEKDSTTYSQRITYAKLYEEYDWIVVMALYMDNVYSCMDETETQIDRNVENTLLVVGVSTAVVVAAALVIITFLEKWYYKNSNKELKEEIYKDSLTKLYNRRAAEIDLNTALNNYKTTGQNAAVFMIDIDDFKQVNDNCGHEKGDFVLENIADTLSRYIRSTDILCRWGGEEFLIICHNLKEDGMKLVADKLLNAVSAFMYECKENNTMSNITISIGISNFSKDDSDYSSAVRRADEALYTAKANGKNQAVIKILEQGDKVAER